MSETYTATGRRKTAVARVWLTPGTGNILINEEPFEEALPTLTLQGEILEPLQVANLRNKFD
ncbi:MAG: 30S ribosomal protein S9, partial [Akkermansiaceae bacterium]